MTGFAGYAFPSDQLGGSTGLTKRELIAAMALQGILANEKLLGSCVGFSTVKPVAVTLAVEYADALLEELK